MGLVATRSDNDGNAVLSTVGENEAPKDRDVENITRQLCPPTRAIVDQVAVWTIGRQ